MPGTEEDELPTTLYLNLVKCIQVLMLFSLLEFRRLSCDVDHPTSYMSVTRASLKDNAFVVGSIL